MNALKPRTLVVAVVAAFALNALPAAAQNYQPAGAYDDRSSFPVGLRAGYTAWDDFEQFHYGLHVVVGEVTENVDFTPNIDFGKGGGLAILTINGDLTYRFTELVSAPWGFYGGASLSMLYLDPDVGQEDTDLGLSAVSGLTRVFGNGHEGRLEARVGILDYPGFKLTVGYTLF